MTATTLLFGCLLIGLGIAGYFGTGSQSPTALIPAGFGLVLAILGLISRQEALRKHAMHIAAALALLGFLFCLPGVAKAVGALFGGSVERPAAVATQTLMAAITGVYVALCARSFREARQRRVGV